MKRGTGKRRETPDQRVEDQALLLVYTAFGLAAYGAQALEAELFNARMVLLLPHYHAMKRPELQAIWDAQLRKSMGQLLNDLSQYTTIPPQLHLALSEAVDTRNDLIHSYFRSRAKELLDPSEHVAMVEELLAIRQSLDEASDSLDGLLRPLRSKFGITDAYVRRFAKKLLGLQAANRLFAVDRSPEE